MCHDDESRPPSPPTVGEVAGHGRFQLTARDGNTLLAYQAEPVAGNGRSVVILPDVRGLHPYYEALTIRFAEAGFTAVAIDYFGRTTDVSTRGDDFDWQSEHAKVTPEQVAIDTAAAVEYLGDSGPVFTVGFCYGGSQSWRLAASDVPLAGCIGLYGKPQLIADVEADIHRPMLLLIAGNDAATPQVEFTDLDARLTAAGRPHETYVYPGAPHAFFDRAYAEWADACQDVWRRILTFTHPLP
jgi:carboxymethylenebutenolidase